MSFQVTAVRAKTYFGREKDIRSIHSRFFHGCASRSGKPYPFESDAYLTNHVRDSLQVIRSGQTIPTITQPASSLVCTGDISSALHGTPSCEFLPVTLSKVVDYWIAKGDMNFYRNAATRKWADKECSYLEHFPDARDKFPQLPQLYELVVPKLIDVAEQFQPLHTVDFYFGEPGYGDAKTYSLSQDLFSTHPVLRQAGVTLFRSDVIERIESFFDGDFFCLCRRDIPV